MWVYISRTPVLSSVSNFSGLRLTSHRENRYTFNSCISLISREGSVFLFERAKTAFSMCWVQAGVCVVRCAHDLTVCEDRAWGPGWRLYIRCTAPHENLMWNEIHTNTRSWVKDSKCKSYMKRSLIITQIYFVSTQTIKRETFSPHFVSLYIIILKSFYMYNNKHDQRVELTVAL